MISLSNKLKKATTILSRRCCFQATSNVKRCLSSSAEPPSHNSNNSKQSTNDKDKAKAKAKTSSTSASASVSAAPRDLPTRHSRHSTPLAAPLDTLENTKQKFVASTPGTLFSYNPKNLHQSKMEEYEQALSECHSLQQKTEYLLRGYSSQLPGSLVNTSTNANTNASASASTTMVDTKVSPPTNPHEIIQNMIQLLERMEQEGKAYVELRSKYRSQLAHVSGNNDNGKNYHHDDIHIDTDIDDDIDIDIDANNDDNDGSGNGTIVDESTNNTAWKMNALVTNFGAPPGPSNTMYDLILDAIAVSISASSAPLELLKMARVVHGRALARYELDVKAGVEQMNPSSCPTPATFNAVIRAAAGISATETGSGIDTETDADAETGIATDTATANMDNEEVRDYAMENAFFTFDAMHHHPVVHRNSSTYRYMLDMIGVIFPVGEVRGNIAAVMWEKAVQDKVIDVPLFEAMQKVGRAEHGELFDNWWKSTEAKFVKDVNGHGFPMIWGKNKKLRRFDRKLDSY